MTALVRSELLKIRTTRGWWAYLAVIVLLVGISAARRDRLGRLADDAARLDFQLGSSTSAGRRAARDHPRDHDRDDRVPARHDHADVRDPAAERVLAAKAVATVVARARFAAARVRRRRRGAVARLVVDAELDFAESEVSARRPRSLLVVLSGCSASRSGLSCTSQVAALVGTLVWIFSSRRCWSGSSGCSTSRACGVPALPGARRRGRHGRRTTCSTTGRRVAVSLGWIVLLGALGGVSRQARRDISWTRTLRRWPRPCGRTRRSSSRSTRSPTAATASRG